MGVVLDGIRRTLDALEADPHGAVLHVPREAAEADARRVEAEGIAGPLAGIAVAVKDNLTTAGIPTTAGSRMLAGWCPLEDAEAVRRLRAAGAIPVAKANLDEFSMGSSGENSAFGPTDNPRAPGRVPGGSSSGSAALVAAGTVPVALGSDTGGSIRQPAALCGVYGLKPTWGRVSRRGLVAFASSLDVVGPMARDTATLAAAYRCLAGPDAGDATTVDRDDPPAGLDGDLSGLRIGVASSLCDLDGVDPVMARRLAETAEVCRAAGAEVRPVSLPDPRDAVAAYYVIAPAEASSNLARYDGVRYGLRVPGETVPSMMAATRSAGFGAEVKRRILLGTFVLAAGYATRTYRRAQALRVGLRGEFSAVFAEHDLVLTPVTPTPAFPRGANARDPLAKYLADLFTVTANLLGTPAAAVPTGEDDAGRPVGMQFLAPRFAEESLLRAAAAVERSGRWPVPRGRAPVSGFEAVIGLEVHVQLRTRSKIFCACPVDSRGAPNAHTCPVCLGHPGCLPVLNREAVRLALRFGAAVGATVVRPSRFARKNYFYPDLPKGYQITQFEEPILAGGEIPFRVGDRRLTVSLERAHLEEDAGKSFHPEGSRERATLVDLNRAGTPLLEIVTRPVLRDPAEAAACLHRIHALVVELGVSDGSMEEGSFRSDANVSVRLRGDEVLHPKTEVKNLNSFRHVERALRWEVARQTRLHEEGEIPASATRLWDEGEGRTRVMRTKEEAEDYRYFPEPDLPPLEVPAAWIEEARAGLPELPWEREERFAAAHELGDEEARLLAGDPALAAYTERVIAGAGDARAAANWVLTEILRLRKETEGGLAAIRVEPEALGRLLRLVKDGTLSTPLAKTVFAVLAAEGGDPDTVVRERGLLPLDDEDALAETARRAVAEHPGPFAQWKKGKETVRGFFVGQVMRATGGRARPDAVGRAVDAALAARRAEEETT